MIGYYDKPMSWFPKKLTPPYSNGLFYYPLHAGQSIRSFGGKIIIMHENEQDVNKLQMYNLSLWLMSAHDTDAAEMPSSGEDKSFVQDDTVLGKLEVIFRRRARLAAKFKPGTESFTLTEALFQQGIARDTDSAGGQTDDATLLTKTGENPFWDPGRWATNNLTGMGNAGDLVQLAPHQMGWFGWPLGTAFRSGTVNKAKGHMVLDINVPVGINLQVPSFIYGRLDLPGAASNDEWMRDDFLAPADFEWTTYESVHKRYTGHPFATMLNTADEDDFTRVAGPFFYVEHDDTDVRMIAEPVEVTSLLSASVALTRETLDIGNATS